MEIITLKNGKNIELEWNFLVLEYLEEYTNEKGKGLKYFKEDIEKKQYAMKIFNFFIFALIRACYDEVLTYRQAVSLVNINDQDKIINFLKENVSKTDEFKKKQSNITYHHRKKKKK